MRLPIFLISFFISCVGAACESLEWKSDGVSYQICFIEKFDAFLSSKCEKSKCAAVEYVNRVKDITLPPAEGRTAINPGSRLCKLLGGTIIMAKNERDSENSFCKAKDDSLVDVNSLSFHAK